VLKRLLLWELDRSRAASFHVAFFTTEYVAWRLMSYIAVAFLVENICRHIKTLIKQEELA
jgi:hypothetical protein